MLPRNASNIKIDGFEVNIDYNVLTSIDWITLTSIKIPSGTILSLSYKIGKMCCRKVRMKCKVVDWFITEE